MAAVCVYLIAALTPQWSSAQSSTVSTVNILPSNNWVIGATLDVNLQSGLPSPFTDASMKEFEAAWNAKEAIQQGTFTQKSYITKSQAEATEELGISASLSMSYMQYSGDAHMSFASETVQSDLDISIFVTWKSYGRKMQMSLSEMNSLKLNTSALTADNLDDFKAQYGAYIIVGFEYGGEIIFESTHSVKSNEDKIAVEVGVGLAYKSMGFDLDVDLETEYSKSDISRSIDSSQEYSIRPNAHDDEGIISDLIDALTAISMGDMDDEETLYAEMSKSAQSLLSSDELDPIKAIVVPLTSLTAVNSYFVDNPALEDTGPFLLFLNEVYMAVVGLEKQLRLTDEAWDSLDRASKPTNVLEEWKQKLGIFATQMTLINNAADIIANSKVYLTIYEKKRWNATVMSADSFMDISESGLRIQFEDAIMQPFWDRMGKTTYHPTTAEPTTEPTTDAPTSWSVPAVDKGGIATNLNECEGDCDYDYDCVGALLCWHRSKWSDPLPPGCSGSPHYEGHDYCYDGNKGIHIQNEGTEPPSILYECQGDCDGDWECDGSLKCWFRGDEEGFEDVTALPPGCVGDVNVEWGVDEPYWLDYCYDPAKNGEAPPTYFVFEVTSFEISVVLIAIVAMCAVCVAVSVLKRLRAAKGMGYAMVVIDSEADDLVNNM